MPFHQQELIIYSKESALLVDSFSLYNAMGLPCASKTLWVCPAPLKLILLAVGSKTRPRQSEAKLAFVAIAKVLDTGGTATLDGCFASIGGRGLWYPTKYRSCRQRRPRWPGGTGVDARLSKILGEGRLSLQK
jgi:hypothetical protein